LCWGSRLAAAGEILANGYRLLRNPNVLSRIGTESERFEIPDENAVVRFKVKQYNGLRLGT